jgi:hypothetical protein
LYFLPLPQGHGAFRPARRIRTGGCPRGAPARGKEPGEIAQRIALLASIGADV